MKSGNDFDTQHRELEIMGAKLQSGCHEAAIKLHAQRRLAYRMVARFVQLRNEHQAELLDAILAKGIGGRAPIDQYLDNLFAPATLIGIDYHDMIRAIDDGMSEKEYLASGIAVWKAQIRGRATATHSRVPADPPAHLSQDEAVKQLRVIVSGLRQENRELRRDNAELRQINAKLMHEHKRVLSLVRRTDAKIAV